MLLLCTSFLAGVLTVLAPCVLPILPIIIGSSTSSKSRYSSIVLIGSLSVSIVIFTLLLRASTVLIAIPQSTWTSIAGLILVAFGVVTLFPRIWNQVSGRANQSTKKLLSSAGNKTGWQRDVAIGLALGPVFNSCSPTYSLILATVLPASYIQGVFYTIVYALGLASVLLLISLVGHSATKRLRLAADPHGWLKKTLGMLFVVVGLCIMFGWDKDIEAYIIDQGYFGITSVEENLVEQLR